MWSIEIRRYMTENRSVGGSIPPLGTTSLSIRSRSPSAYPGWRPPLAFEAAASAR
jgi:hypothetical protein